jgi:tripartite-type tricarboxylate transporter receptor subunit TctC
MKRPRRQFLWHLAGAIIALPAVSRIAGADAYPTRPVRLIVPFPAGGATDIVARLIGQWLSERLGQQFVIDNRPGAATNIATAVVVRALPDGYTLLFAATAASINATLYEKLDFNFIRDILPVAGIARVPLVLLVHPSVPAATVPELIAYVKSNPGKISIATTGTGSVPHMSAELFKVKAGIDIVEVPYRGDTPVISDLLNGRVQMFFGAVTSFIEHIRASKLRAIAITTATRSELLPDVPTMAEFLPGFEVSAWFGIGAPRNTPIELVDKLNKEINAGLADPRMKARLTELAASSLAGSPTDFGTLIAEETEKWGQVIRAANIKRE